MDKHSSFNFSMRSSIGERVFRLPRRCKQAILMVSDMIFMMIAIWSSIAFRLGHTNFTFHKAEYIAFAMTIIISMMVFLRMGLYRAVVRFMGQQAILTIIRATVISSLFFSCCLFLTRGEVPRSSPFIYFGLLMFFIGGSRLFMRTLYQSSLRKIGKKVIIYGAGSAGRQILTSIHHGGAYSPVCFIDDDVAMQGRIVNGLKVHSPDRLNEIVTVHEVSHVLLAMPKAERERRRFIVQSLESLPVHVKTVPSFEDLIGGRAELTELQDVEIEDLLGREPVPPHPELLERCIIKKRVLVTGAGGSIGSELCRQIMASNPEELILFDCSEYALYKIHQELIEQRTRLKNVTKVVPMLGSVRSEKALLEIMRTFEVQTVYHAAAYKHVPLVEYNVTEGILNNIYGTKSAAEAAVAAGVETFVLVSTDKAVRPTNVMGASKRVAELVLQALSQIQDQTRFCMVRFGNVLGSSGSVVPLFRQQIKNGGPVTVTHKDVVRYFMTIPEAAQLVLQASAMGTGGDVFVLDMGQPVQIIDLAKRMIRLMGREVKTTENPSGEIEITFSGLRPGEKLYEELLVGDNVSGTGHPMILRAEEDALPHETLVGRLEELKSACDSFDTNSLQEVLVSIVPGFLPKDGLSDVLWRKRQLSLKNLEKDNIKSLFPNSTVN